MGCFDSFYFRCPHCGKEIEQQTKLGDCLLQSWKIGDKVSGLPDGSFVTKGGCYECNGDIEITIKNSIFVSASKPIQPTIKEGSWGTIEDFKP